MTLTTDRLHTACLAGLATLLVWWAVASLWWPLGWDQGIFAWIGEVALHGGMPYRDAWDVKGPLTFYVFGVVDALTGGGTWGIRLFDVVLLGGALWALSRVTHRWAGPIVAGYTALLFGLAYARLGFWDIAQPDGWVALLTTLAFVPLLTAESAAPGPGYRAAAVVGLCALFKPVYLPLVIVPATWLVSQSGLTETARGRRLIAAGLALAVPLAVTAAWFAARGAWTHLIDGYVLFNLENSATSQTRNPELLRPLYWSFVSQPIGLLTLPLAIAGLAQLWRPQRRVALLLGGWLLTAVLAVAIQRRWYPYQVPPIYPPLALLGAAGAAALVGRLRAAATPTEAQRRVAGPLVVAALLLLAYPLAKPVAGTAASWLRWQTGAVSTQEHFGAFAEPAVHFRADLALALADYVRSTTEPGDTVLVWNDPTVNYLAGRPSLGPYIFHVPLLGDPPTPRQERYRRLFLERFHATPPALVLVEARALDPRYANHQANLVRAFPQLVTALRAGYHEVDRVAGYRAFRPGESGSNISSHRPIFPPVPPTGGVPSDRPR